MKKFLLITLMLALTLSLAACGRSNAPSGSTSNPSASNSTTQPASSGDDNSTSTPPSNTPDNTPSGGALYDLTDDQITAYDEIFTMLQGEERTTMLAVIPAETKKAIGTVGAGLCIIQPDQVDGSGYLFSMVLYVSDSADYKTLTDYYKSLGGTIKSEADIQLNIDYSWGRLKDCVYMASSGSPGNSISVTFDIE